MAYLYQGELQVDGQLEQSIKSANSLKKAFNRKKVDMEVVSCSRGAYRQIYYDVCYFHNKYLKVFKKVMQSKAQKNKYGYIVYPGNNPTVIENALKKRNVWQALLPEKDLLSACFVWKQLNLAPKVYSDFDEILKLYPSRHVLLNHFESNHVITTKSGILKTLKYYYSHELALSERNPHIHEVIPTSFYIKAHKNDTEYKDFIEKFHQLQKRNYYKEKVPEKHCEKNVWFIKPESDNQGKGIILSNNFKEIQSFLISKPVNSGWIVQKAIEQPLLYNGRKFDVRVWVLVTPQLDIYYFNTPYLRTSSTLYNLDSMSSEIHLTNNCQQKHFGEYSKYEEGNTIPMKETLLAYFATLPESQGQEADILNSIVGKMKEIIIDTLMSARKFFNRGGKKKQFQLFGYDFLIDVDFRTWLLEVNNNPYLGVPNSFIKDLLPKMIDELIEIVVDPLFPPENYIPVSEKRFQLIYRQQTLFRLNPIRMTTNFSESKYNIPERKTSTSKQKTSALERVGHKSDLYNVGKEEKSLKPVYSTPSQTLRYLLDNYCFNDLDPFMVPVNLILSSASLADDQCVQANLKKLRLITETRIAKILLEPRIFELCSNIISQDRFGQKIKTALAVGFTNSCKNFKAKIFIIKNLMPLLCESIRSYKSSIEQPYLESLIKLIIATGGQLDRTVFIPGQSRQNQFIRQVFIKSNSLKLLLYLNKKYSHICPNQVSSFLANLSQKDWQLFYQVTGNKNKRCYSPKVRTDPQHDEETIVITSSVIDDQKPKTLSLRQNAEIKNFRTRRHSGISSKKD